MHESVSSPDPNEQLHDPEIVDVRLELLRQAAEPPGNDPIIADFCTAVLEKSHSQDMELMLQVAMASTNSAPYAVNKLLRSIQKQLLRPSEIRYPQYVAENGVDGWSKLLDRLLDNPQQFDEICTDLTDKETQSTVVQRYNTLKSMLVLLSDRFGETVSVLDIGCSSNAGLKKLAVGTPFDNVQIVRRDRHRHYRSSSLLTKKYNELLAQPLQLGQSYGVDIFNPRVNEEWIRACSFYPSELLNGKLLTEYATLEERDPPNVGFVEADVSHGDQLESARVERNGPMAETQFDAVFLSTVLYMLNPEERENALSVALRHTKPNGVVIAQDFMDNRMMLTGPGGEKYAYAAVIFDKLGDPTKPQEILRYEFARCKKAVIGAGRIAIAGADLTLAEALKQRS